MNYYLNENDYPDNYDFLDDAHKSAVVDNINNLHKNEMAYFSFMESALSPIVREYYADRWRKECDSLYAARKALEAAGILIDNLGGFTNYNYAIIDRSMAVDYNAYLYDIANEQREDHDDED